MAKVYTQRGHAEARMIKLMKDGLCGLRVERCGTGYTVIGDPGLKPVQRSTFGLLIEPDFVVEAALSLNPSDIKEYDVGHTFGLTVAEVKRMFA